VQIPICSRGPGDHRYSSLEKKVIEEQRQLSWNDCRWISNLFDRSPLGGIDATASGKGMNGSISPSATIVVLEALQAAGGSTALIDAGCSEGRALLHWASLVAWHQRAPQAINLYGFDLPHLKMYRCIHNTAEGIAQKHLGIEVRFNCVWKDCIDMTSLQSEFAVLSNERCVIYSFWTAWYAEDKLKLLKLIRAETNITAIAVYFTTKDFRCRDQKFSAEFILAQLGHNSTSHSWTLFKRVPKCRFIRGNETATALVFKKVQKEPSLATCETQHTQALSVKDACFDTSKPVHWDGIEVIGSGVCQDNWLDTCNECGGGGEE
jgi:hypothetical protein